MSQKLLSLTNGSKTWPLKQNYLEIYKYRYLGTTQGNLSQLIYVFVCFP